MRMTGVGPVTDAGRAANMLVMGMWLSDAFKLPYSQLRPRTQTVLGTHRIDARSWDYIRSLPELSERYDGVDVVFLDRLNRALQREVQAKKITRETADSFFLNYDTFISEHAQVKGIPAQDIYTGEFWSFNANNPDSVSHNFGKFLAQYKPIMTASYRSLLDASHGKTPHKRRDTNPPNTPLSLIHI